jgi:hypothetical protein
MIPFGNGRLALIDTNPNSVDDLECKYVEFQVIDNKLSSRVNTSREDWYLLTTTFTERAVRQLKCVHQRL